MFVCRLPKKRIALDSPEKALCYTKTRGGGNSFCLSLRICLFTATGLNLKVNLYTEWEISRSNPFAALFL